MRDTEQISIRLHSVELAKLQTAARLSGLSLNDFVRQAAMSAAIETLPSQLIYVDADGYDQFLSSGADKQKNAQAIEGLLNYRASWED